MAEVNVQFMHPTDGRKLEVTLDNTMTTQEVIDELITSNFVPINKPHGYDLSIKGGAQLQALETLESSGVKDADVIRVIPATDAG